MYLDKEAVKRSIDRMTEILNDWWTVRDALRGGPLTIPQVIARVREQHGLQESTTRQAIQSMIDSDQLNLDRDMRVSLHELHLPEAWPPGSLMSYTSDAFHDCGVVVGNFDNHVVVLWATGAKSLVMYPVEQLNLAVVKRVQRFGESA